MNEFFKAVLAHNVPFVVCFILLLVGVVYDVFMGIVEIILWGQLSGGVIETFLSAAIVLTVLFLLVRYRVRTYYFRMCDLNGGREASRTVLIGEDVSIPDHSANMPEHYRFSQIVKTYETKHLYILMTRSKIGIVLAKDGFVKGTLEACKSYVELQRRGEQNI